MDFQILPASTFQLVSLGLTGTAPDGRVLSGPANFYFDVRDTSVDPATAQQPVPHRVSFSVQWLESSAPNAPQWDRDPAWQFQNATTAIPTIVSGGTWRNELVVLNHEPSARLTRAAVRVIATMTSDYYPGVSVVKNETFSALIVPSPGISAQLDILSPSFPTKAGPNEWVTVPMRVLNTDLYQQQITIDLIVGSADGIDPANIPVRGEGAFLFEPLEEKIIEVTFRTPKERFYYGSLSMSYSVLVHNTQNENIRYEAAGVLILQGFYVSTPVVWIIPLLVMLLVLLILLLVFAKKYYDERVIGKPIAPWRIPQEAAALEVLRRENPREFYIWRYFLMEQEYASALHWFYSFKKRSKRALKQEAEQSKYVERVQALQDPSLKRYERKAERLRRRFHARQERRRLQLEAKLEKLQGKLDQSYDEDFEKDHEAWEKQVEKIKKKSNKPWYRTHKKWEAEVEKILEEWEKPFAKERAKNEKEIAKAKEAYAKQVKKKDKQTWREWREAVENAQQENKVRAKEGREAIAMPDIVSSAVPVPEYPAPFKAPPKPKLPPEPRPPENLDLPPEPQKGTPVLETSHYAKKVKRLRRKTDRKIARLEHKLERALAKNERDSVRRLAKADRKRSKLIRRSELTAEPTIIQRLLRRSPASSEQKSHRALLKALAKEKLQAFTESETGRLETLRIDAQRREAELVVELVRSQADSQGGAIEVEKDPRLLALRSANEKKLASEEAASRARIAKEKVRLEAELKAQLTEELIKERARAPSPAPQAPPTARPSRHK